MSETFVCKSCRKVKTKNPRIKTGQQYCGDKNCQQKRKNSWEKHKLKTYPEYKEKRKKQKQLWYEKKPGHSYQTEYRKNHPFSRNSTKKYQEGPQQKKAPKIIKGSDLINAYSGLYRLVPYTNPSDEKIVKTDSLIVRIDCLSGFYEDISVET